MTVGGLVILAKQLFTASLKKVPEVEQLMVSIVRHNDIEVTDRRLACVVSKLKKSRETGVGKLGDLPIFRLALEMSWLNRSGEPADLMSGWQ